MTEKIFSDLELMINQRRFNRYEFQLLNHVEGTLNYSDNTLEKVYTNYLLYLRHKGIDYEKNKTHEQTMMSFMGDYYNKKNKK